MVGHVRVNSSGPEEIAKIARTAKIAKGAEQPLALGH